VPPYGGVYGYTTDDIYYLEVCMFNQICENGAELFQLRAGAEWQCSFSPERFRELQDIITEPATIPDDAHECRHGSTNKQSGKGR
jgi:hypothetical protein